MSASSLTVSDSTDALVARICTDGWATAVAGHLAAALDDAAWTAVRTRPRRQCRLFAQAATKIEESSSALADAAGLGAADLIRSLGLSTVAQKTAEALVVAALPKVGEAQTAAVARCLRIVGVWICLPDHRFPRCCVCLEALAKEHTAAWIQDALERELTGLGEPVSPAR